MRLNKLLVNLSVASSRRAADDLINSGYILDQDNNRLTFDSDTNYIKEIKYLGNTYTVDSDNQIKRAIILLNKPIGYVCSNKDKYNKTIFELLPSEYKNYKIAGRLDKDSEGLVILSNDGDFVNHLIHPSSNKSKVYIIKTDKELSQDQIELLLNGVEIDSRLARIYKIDKVSKLCYKLELKTGLNRQIRKSLALLGIKVTSLARIKIADYDLGRLNSSKYVII